MDYTIIGNTLILSDDAKQRMTETELQSIFDHFIKVVMKNEQKNREPVSIVRENAQIFDLADIWKEKPKVSFGPCLVREIPRKNRGYKHPAW